MGKLIITFLLSIFSLAAFAQADLSAILDTVQPSSIFMTYIDIQDANGNRSEMPLAVVNGRKKGPTLTIMAGVHGYEYPPIIATQELIQEIDPALVSGTIILIPMANPNSFYNRTPFLNPQDKLNLNRVFPGNNQGSITEKIANYITKNVIAHSDVFIDVHGGDANEDLLPFICYYRNESKANQTALAKSLAEASGFEYIVSYPYNLQDDQKAKYAFKQAVQDGKVALSIECGKLGNLQTDAVAKIKSGLFKMLNEMKMYKTRNKKKIVPINLNNQAYIKSYSKGVFSSALSAGQKVKEGEIVGYVKNDFGVILNEVMAPISGTIIYMIGTPPVNDGETIMCIGYSTNP